MADFLTRKKLEEKITDIIFHAKETLLILSPYIKLDDYFTKLFSNHLNNPSVNLIIVFGKNEDNKGKSLRKEDFEFFKQFPNVSILYLKDLHAKYYANEEEGVVTSVNLHDYSFKNNIEFGVHSKNPEQSLLGLTTIINPFNDGLDSNAWEMAFGFMRQAEAVFIKRPVIQKKLLGLNKTHMGSEVCHDETDFFTRSYQAKSRTIKRFDDFPDHIEFGKAKFQEKPVREDVAVEPKNKTYQRDAAPATNNNQRPYNSGYNHNYQSRQNQLRAFCIRTGEPIKFNTNFPFSDSAYASWKQWRNEDYTEKFCHSCGRPHATTKRRPLCEGCFYN